MKTSGKMYLRLLLGFGLLFFTSIAPAFGDHVKKRQYTLTQVDSILSAEIKQQLANNELNLYYPNSVKRFYRSIKFISPWNKQQTETGSTWQAMLFIDCVLQYGLCHDDYHPKEITYAELHDILEKPGSVSINRQARFDIFLTDAMLNLINNLHFGKLNPDFTHGEIDNFQTGFIAGQTLAKALSAGGFKKTICEAQPKSKQYADMQYHMYLWTGLYTGDCYEVPENKIRKLAINMERLRWVNIDTSARIEINIPSYTLTLFEHATNYTFKVIVGKAVTPSPTLQSQISFFTTTPDLRMADNIFVKELLPDILNPENNQYVLHNKTNEISSLLFGFSNSYNVSIHDTHQKHLFEKQARAFSNGSILVEHADRLATLLLKYDNASNKTALLHKEIATHKTLKFNLSKPVLVNITYFTCVVKNGKVLDYNDVYGLDDKLEMEMYNAPQKFVTK